MKSLNIKYVSKFDHIRFFAAFCVMLFHFNRNKYTENLAFGVEIFFVLSAFLFTVISHAGDKEIKYSTFIYNRFIRIFPLVIVCFVCLISIMRDQFKGVDVFNLLFLNMSNGMKPMRFEYGSAYLSFPWWTIHVEFLFYLIFPFLISFYKKYGIKYLLLCMVMKYILYSMILAISVHDGSKYGDVMMSLNYSIIGHLDSFIIGMIGGILYIRNDLAIMSKSYISLTLIPVILVLLYKNDLLIEYFDPYPCLETTLQSLLIVCFILLYTKSKIAMPKIIDNALSKLGIISFSTYLLHEVIRDWLYSIELLSSKHEIWGYEFMICIATVYFIASISYLVIEKPFLDIRKRYIK
jgi:peptidoglycan/LPS O-acetylase OafA/YrhL